MGDDLARWHFITVNRLGAQIAAVWRRHHTAWVGMFHIPLWGKNLVFYNCLLTMCQLCPLLVYCHLVVMLLKEQTRAFYTAQERNNDLVQINYIISSVSFPNDLTGIRQLVIVASVQTWMFCCNYVKLSITVMFDCSMKFCQQLCGVKYVRHNLTFIWL